MQHRRLVQTRYTARPSETAPSKASPVSHYHLTTLLLTACLAVTGCGLKGDLYLPDEPSRTQQAERDNAGGVIPDAGTAEHDAQGQ